MSHDVSCVVGSVIVNVGYTIDTAVRLGTDPRISVIVCLTLTV